MKDKIPVYYSSFEYAKENGELEHYLASSDANIACREAIERAINDYYKDTQTSHTYRCD